MTLEADDYQVDEFREPREPGKHRHQWARYPLIIAGPNGEQTRDECRVCRKVKDEALSRRGRLARLKGNRIQRERIVALGGRNLAGNNPNLDGLGAMFAYESKSGGAFSQRVWRWLTDIPKRGNETGVLIITETPGPGRKARSYVVVEYSEWRDLHGELE